MKLFVIYIGGTHPRSLIEVHDIRFIVAENLEQTYEFLKTSWWGTPKSLHIDAWGVLTQADGYDISFSEQETHATQKLFFVNLGGYDNAMFTELHKNIFLVAKNENEAKTKALVQAKSWKSAHRDNLYEIDDIVNISLILTPNFKMQLTPKVVDKYFEFTCCYLPIGRT
ncbi:DUF1543 domain-containing protein [Legionella longbeachae]|uniref:DUF1543 domain-containing protein n=1 Tax=Legionella longbeachae TaxID=450 RepID=UPI0001BEB8F8|nr:DUF1543 domain-containing protein [Legionella longbeachae]EEZ93449.1 conserved hypothetical protein [Legionella longbeachae D-4968]QIN34161.1 DUF1543 domain-containing protein [Legionella longbeachae]HBD7399128.1 DUF1543 domain-containing protein [Legionella pneumophila]